MKANKQPTMKDVSEAAGVSLGTVSKVFNGIPVGEKYKNKVLKAADELGYQVNVYARGLRSSKTNTIALILPTLTVPFFSTFADLCCKELQEKGYRTILATTSYNGTQEQECIDMVQQHKVDGIIAITYNPELEVNEDIPFVIIDRSLGNNIPCISSDHYSGGMLAAEKLVENGCKNLLFLGMFTHVAGEVDKRPLGFENYCQNHNIKFGMHKCYEEDGIENLQNFVEQNIIDGKFSYDGIFCNTDSNVISIMETLNAHNIRVPEDVQLVGFDGIKNFATGKYICSTICQPIDDMVKTAVDMLLSESSRVKPALICLPVEYAYGGTTLK